MEGGYYFSTRSFGCIDIPPWVARKVAIGPAAKEYYEVGRAALQVESDEAYFVVDYCSPANDGRLPRGRVGVYGGGVCTLSASGNSEGPLSSRSGGYGEFVNAQGSTSVSSACSRSSISSCGIESGAAEDCIGAVCPTPQLSAPAPHNHVEIPSFYSASTQTDGSPKLSAVPLPISNSTSWLDLDSSESFLDDLQDIDDSWLDNLPPLHIASPSISSSSAGCAGGARPRLIASSALSLPAHWPSLYVSNNPNPFNTFPDSITPAAFDVFPVSLDVSPSPQARY
ncbi:hypothetical protein L7F22_025474 [Adiantum nelumboides]|nr:hypothetical protein [Adiantum nelumboides]